MASEAFRASKRRRVGEVEAGPFVFRTILDKNHITNDDTSQSIAITAVEYWNDNLYIGTSTSEILHLVSIPSGSEDDDTGPTFIQASRLSPSGHGNHSTIQQHQGVRQILVLPGPSKACVLCNGVVSFYSLPELSPAFPTKELSGVQWIGGPEKGAADENPEGSIVMIATARRIIQVRVGDKLRPLKANIEYPACLKATRRGAIACVADRASYALIDVEHQQKIPLFPISSLPVADDTQGLSGTDEIVERQPSTDSRSTSKDRSQETPAHSRSTSLGSYLASPQPRSPRLQGQDSKSLRPPDSASRGASPTAHGNNRPRSSTAADHSLQPEVTVGKSTTTLTPHIASPSENEFLLTTGTNPEEPGVGMFVNLDGEVVRSTIEFESYPSAVILETDPLDRDFATGPVGDEGGTVHALITQASVKGHGMSLESQILSAESMAPPKSKTRLALPTGVVDLDASSGVFRALSYIDRNFSEVASLLCQVRYHGRVHAPSLTKSMSLPGPDPRTRTAVERVEEEKALFDSHGDEQFPRLSPEREQQRNAEEFKFARGFGSTRSCVMVWHDCQLWQVLKNPFVIQLESRLWQGANTDANGAIRSRLDFKKVLSVVAGIKGREPDSEAEFVSMNYIRQKASLMLLVDLLRCIEHNEDPGDLPHATETVLLEGGVDPRVVLMLLPEVQADVREGTEGIWINNGLAELLETCTVSWQHLRDAPAEFWLLLRRYLSSWQDKRGYASIQDERNVFDTVDTALLRVLLHLDVTLPRGSGLQVSTRAKLNNVVDHWKGDFPAAVSLLEEQQRLFVLSRLYQSRKMAKNVLETWRRIANGEKDIGGEMGPTTVEIQVRQYLMNIRNAAVVQEYSMWLAQRNPEIAIQLLTDASSRVKFSPSEVVSMLKAQAPDAVQVYLEHLVFNQHLDQYADDLIEYYLDSVLSVLETSEEAKQSLSDSYSTYRALEKPKPTYLGFITENAPLEPWWRSRLRLLQLLGAGGYAVGSASGELTYSIPKVIDRLAPFSKYLVSESIILDARQGRHNEALRLLTHGLGDYDTAVRYCYFGGPTSSSSQPVDASLLPSREVQRSLFAVLFEEFLAIEDPGERLDRTSDLLGKFASWLDPLTIFSRLPDEWTVDDVGEFLLRTFRSITSEHNEAIVLRALSAAQNLQRQAAFVEACEKYGMKIEAVAHEAATEA